MAGTLLRVGTRFAPTFETVRPRLANPVTWMLLIAGLALIARLPLFFVRAEPYPGGDSRGYLEYADSIGNFEFPGMVRTPGYPFYLWAVGLLPGRTEDAAVVVQHLIGIALAVALVALGWRLFSPAAGVVAGMLAAISPAYVSLEDVILPDFMLAACALAGAAALALAVADERHARRLLVLAGLAFALAAYVKPVGQVLALAAPIVFFTTTRDWRSAVRSSAVVIGVMVLALAPWVVRNAIVNGDASMSNQAGVTLFNRAFEIDKFAVPTDDEEGRLAARLTAEALATPGARPSSFVNTELVRRGGYTIDESLAIQRRLASEAILSNLPSYLRTSGRQLRGTVNSIGATAGPERQPLGPGAPERLPQSSGIPRASAQAVIQVGTRLAELWFLLTVHAVIGLVLLFLPDGRRRAAVALLTVGLLIVVATVLTHGGAYRYSLQVAPELWLLGSAGLVYLFGAAISRMRGAGRAAAGPTA